jgi:2-keto-4-pentenoate hydratase/2-oxohepta-3-ene-1,7-dioic acid hydratase in catechol pathway
MKLYSAKTRQGKAILAAEANGQLVDLQAAWWAAAGSAIAFPTDMAEFISGSDSITRAQKAIAFALQNTGEDYWYSFDEVTLGTPLKRPGKIFCSGLNYRSHVTENPNARFLDEPRFFLKVASAVIGPGEPIRHPGEKFEVDWEVELAVIIGKRCHRATAAEAMDYIFGYSILHDVSSRYIQFKDNNECMGKNFDTFCPLGPCIVTADEIPEPEKLKLRTWVNGVIMQDGTNEDWCFSLPQLIEWLSMGVTLEPGDIISTGTPAGVGLFRNPPVYLKPGDEVELEISSIGKLRNPVVADLYVGRAY